MEISNKEFLTAIFGANHQQAHVTSFTQDPSNIATSEAGRSWAGGLFSSYRLQPDSNQFYTVSLFASDGGKANRRRQNFTACYVIALDDVKEKLPIEQVMKLPPPSIVLKSSLHSEQWLYLLATPETNPDRIDNLHDGLIANGLAPDGKDPGQKSVTRYLRLPEGVNTKAKRIAENGGTPPRCEVTEWHPERRYSLEQLALPFNVDLNTVRVSKSVDAADVSDHPLVNIPDIITIKEVRSDGRFDIRCPWVDEHTGGDDSGSALFTNADGSIGFKCHHGACDSRTGKDLLDYIEQHDLGFNDRLKSWQVMREFLMVGTTTDSPSVKPVGSALDRLYSTTANGESTAMKLQMGTDKYVLKDLAILGQWTVIYAGPNTGKTLLTQWLLREAVNTGEIDGNKVFYANCDDNFKGGVGKLEIAEDVGYQILLPNVKGFKQDTLLATMQAISVAGEASGVVIVLDTLKKFTELMDKRTATSFGNTARGFVSAGGTLICLAHINKHKGEDGKSIHTGTSDIRDDSDCVYMIEHIGSSDTLDGTIHTVQFENTKSRGDVADKVAFQYTKTKGSGYRALLDSVHRVDTTQVEQVQQQVSEVEQRQLDKDAIEIIKAAIVNGCFTKTSIEKFVTSTSDLSFRNTRKTLAEYEGRLWAAKRGEKNSTLYTLIESPMFKTESPVSFL